MEMVRSKRNHNGSDTEPISCVEIMIGHVQNQQKRIHPYILYLEYNLFSYKKKPEERFKLLRPPGCRLTNTAASGPCQILSA